MLLKMLKLQKLQPKQTGLFRPPPCFYSLACSRRLKVEKHKNYAVLRLCNSPVNTLQLDFIREITSTLKDLEADEQCNGLILTSGIPNIFSSGFVYLHCFVDLIPWIGLTWQSYTSQNRLGSKYVTFSCMFALGRFMQFITWVIPFACKVLMSDAASKLPTNSLPPPELEHHISSKD